MLTSAPLLLVLLALARATLRLAVVGGTHGNEYAGVAALRRADSPATRQNHPNLHLTFLLANERAHLANARFIHTDLNRCFGAQALAAGRHETDSDADADADADADTDAHELRLARHINARLGPKGSADAIDVVIDMHTSTANMGACLIVDDWCPLAMWAAAYVREHWDAECAAEDGAGARAGAGGTQHELRVLLQTGKSQAETPYLSSVGRAGIEIEVGPTPQGLLRADVLATTERALRLLLRFFDTYAVSDAPGSLLPSSAARTLRVFVDRGKISWGDNQPGTNLPGCMVHHSLQDRDFEPLAKGAPLFERDDGSVVAYDGALGEVVYPAFVNEAAYYLHDSGRGVGFFEVRDVELPDLPRRNCKE